MYVKEKAMSKPSEPQLTTRARLFITVTDKFIEQLWFLSDKVFHSDYSNTICRAINDVFGNKAKINDFHKYFTENASSIEVKDVVKSGIMKNYSIGDKELRLLDKIIIEKEGARYAPRKRSVYMRALISYLYELSKQTASSLSKETVEGIEKLTGLKLTETFQEGNKSLDPGNY